MTNGAKQQAEGGAKLEVAQRVVRHRIFHADAKDDLGRKKGLQGLPREKNKRKRKGEKQ